MTSLQVFYTNSLKLRPVKKSDFDKVFEWENDQSNWLQSGITEPYGKSEIEAYVSNVEHLKQDGQTRYVIELKDKKRIGCIDLFEYSQINNTASVGLLIESKYRKHGYGLEALSGLSHIAKELYGLEVLKAVVLAENKSSVNLFEKDGYLLDVTKETTYRYQNKTYNQLTYFKQL